MQINTIIKLQNDSKALEYLRLNSYWYKDLNRSEDNYSKMIGEMKARERIKTVNKVDNTIDNLKLVGSILNVIK